MYAVPNSNEQNSPLMIIIEDMHLKGLVEALTETDGDKTNNSENDKFKFFEFVSRDYYIHGLTKKIQKFSRSIEEECLQNDNGKWAEEYQYIVSEPAKEKVSPNNNNRIRDKGHNGMTLKDFLDHTIAVEANLALSEVCVLRLYTGGFYQPFNETLRAIESNPEQLKSWQTCISVLYSAIIKLSCTNAKRRKVYRGADRRLKDEFFSTDDTVAGGAEVSFISSTMDPKVAVSYALRGGNKDITLFEIPLDGGSTGADVSWISQYPEEVEILFPPCTYITCTGKPKMLTSPNFIQRNICHVVVRAEISTQRPNTARILDVKDKDIE